MRTISLFTATFIMLLFYGCQEEEPSIIQEAGDTESVESFTFVYSGKEYLTEIIQKDGGFQLVDKNSFISKVLDNPDLIIFDPADKENYQYLFDDRGKYDVFLERRYTSTRSNARSTFSGYRNSYIRMGDANAYDPNYNNYPEIDVINDPIAASLTEYPYGGSSSSPNEHHLWRGINNLFYYTPSFTDKASSIVVRNDTNYPMIVHFNKHGNYSGWLYAKELNSYSTFFWPDLRYGEDRNWDNEISAVIWKWL